MLRKNFRTRILKTLFLAGLCLITLSSCSSRKDDPLVIWTNNKEFAIYIEHYNATHSNSKAILVYKEEPSRSLPPAKDEPTPDLVIGSWLKNSTTRKYFSPLDYLFQENGLNRSIFYEQIIDYGVINEKQYIIPISFNTPMIAYDARQDGNLPAKKTINLEQIKQAAISFNTLDKSQNYTAMGFAPSWDADFLYFVSKVMGASYREKGTNFSWNEDAMANTAAYLKKWTQDANRDTTTEQNFNFKYLPMPEYKQVMSGRCLFAYMTSQDFFTLLPSQSQPLGFKWIEQNGSLAIEDSIISVGLYKHAKHTKQAEQFLSWFFTEQTQIELLDLQEEMKLDTRIFGIASGFSSIAQVNEKSYTSHYPQLLGALPDAKTLTLPNILPYRWQSLKEQVIIPYLEESINTDSTKTPATLEDRIADWSKQFF